MPLEHCLAISAAVTIVSSAFDLYAMRHGVFVVGDRSGRLVDDLLGRL